MTPDLDLVALAERLAGLDARPVLPNPENDPERRDVYNAVTRHLGVTRCARLPLHETVREMARALPPDHPLRVGLRRQQTHNPERMPRLSWQGPLPTTGDFIRWVLAEIEYAYSLGQVTCRRARAMRAALIALAGIPRPVALDPTPARCTHRRLPPRSIAPPGAAVIAASLAAHAPPTSGRCVYLRPERNDP